MWSKPTVAQIIVNKTKSVNIINLEGSQFPFGKKKVRLGLLTRSLWEIRQITQRRDLSRLPLNAQLLSIGTCRWQSIQVSQPQRCIHHIQRFCIQCTGTARGAFVVSLVPTYKHVGLHIFIISEQGNWVTPYRYRPFSYRSFRSRDISVPILSGF